MGPSLEFIINTDSDVGLVLAKKRSMFAFRHSHEVGSVGEERKIAQNNGTIIYNT